MVEQAKDKTSDLIREELLSQSTENFEQLEPGPCHKHPILASKKAGNLLGNCPRRVGKQFNAWFLFYLIVIGTITILMCSMCSGATAVPDNQVATPNNRYLQSYKGETEDYSFQVPAVHRYIVASFSEINYAWDDDHQEEEYMYSGQFKASVNVIAGIKIKAGVATNPEAAEVFLAVPRWLNGVPSTLNQITINLTNPEVTQNVVLRPFPSWDMQEVGNCSRIQYVQSFEIDNNGHIWVIDTGRVGIFTANPDNACPPKLLIFDANTGEMLDEPYIFPSEVAPYDSAFLNDIVLDNDRGVAYITDMMGNGVGGLITYDRAARESSRFYDDTMAPELGFSWAFRGEDLITYMFPQPTEAIALTPDGSRVFYGALQGSNIFSVDTAALRGEIDTPPEETIISHGARHGSTDGMTIDCAGYLYYSDLTTASVYRWDTSSLSAPIDASELLAQDTDKMWWTDTYAWDDANFLWTTANHLPTVFVNGSFERVNIFRIPTDTGSYQNNACERNPRSQSVLTTDAESAPTRLPVDEGKSNNKEASTTEDEAVLKNVELFNPQGENRPNNAGQFINEPFNPHGESQPNHGVSFNPQGESQTNNGAFTNNMDSSDVPNNVCIVIHITITLFQLGIIFTGVRY